MQPRPQRYEPSPAEVVAAVNSLYDDELKPFGRILLKRLRERAWNEFSRGGTLSMEDQAGFAHIDPKYLRRICEACPNLRVELADGREYTALLIGRPANFVDVCDSRDHYASELWTAASAYFSSLNQEEGTLPGGRYACAQLLVSRGVPFLQHRSLGEVCHIVQLAVSQKKILGYLEGNMVPYEHSEEYVKERCAAWRQPVGGVDRLSSSQLRLATWVDVRSCLREILCNNCNPCPGTITMSNVKRLFRSHFNLELSETVLGYSRLCELLQDARLRDVCSIRSLGNGLVVVQRARGPNGGACQEAKPFVGIVGGPSSCPGSRSSPPIQRRSSTCASMRSARDSLEWDACDFSGSAGLVDHHFDGMRHYHYQEAPSLGAAPQQLEWDGYGMMNYADIGDQYYGMDYYQTHGTGFLENSVTSLTSNPCVQSAMLELGDIYAGSNACTENFASNFIGTALAHEVMSPSSEPGTPKETSSDNFGTDLSTGCETCSSTSLDDSPRMRAAGSAADADADLAAWQMALMSPKSGDTSGMLPADEQTPPSSPSRLAEQGFIVRNTFIHYPHSEHEKTKRSRSVPRGLDSPTGRKQPSPIEF